MLAIKELEVSFKIT